MTEQARPYFVTVTETNIYRVMARSGMRAEAIVFEEIRGTANPEYERGESPVDGEVIKCEAEVDHSPVSTLPIYISQEQEESDD